MKFRPIFIPLAAVVFSCSVVTDDAIDYIPSAARPKVITISGSGASLVGMLSYEGTFKSPSKITIAWQGDTFLNRAPVSNTAAQISTTIYELTSGRVTKITNSNTRNVATRIETLSYNPQGSVLKHVQTNKTSAGDPMNEITSDFFYKGNVVDSIAQVVKWWDGVVWPGFIVRLTGEGHRASTQNLQDKCTFGSAILRSANYTGIMPYDPKKPYTLENRYIDYYNETTKEYEFSVNDFVKSFYVIPDPDESFKITSGSSYVQVQRYGQLITECTTMNLEMRWEVYYNYGDSELLNNYDEVAFTFDGRDSQTMNPIYYHSLLAPTNQDYPLMIPQTDFISIMNKKIEALYFNDYRQNLPASSSLTIELLKKTTQYDLSK